MYMYMYNYDNFGTMSFQSLSVDHNNYLILLTVFPCVHQGDSIIVNCIYNSQGRNEVILVSDLHVLWLGRAKQINNHLHTAGRGEHEAGDVLCLTLLLSKNESYNMPKHTRSSGSLWVFSDQSTWVSMAEGVVSCYHIWRVGLCDALCVVSPGFHRWAVSV